MCLKSMPKCLTRYFQAPAPLSVSPLAAKRIQVFPICQANKQTFLNVWGVTNVYFLNSNFVVEQHNYYTEIFTWFLMVFVVILLYTSPRETRQRLATGWTVRGSNSGGSEIFCTGPDRPWSPPSLLYNGSFPGLKRPVRGVDHPPPSSAEVKETIELYLYSSVSQPPGRGPVTGPVINYAGPREVLLEFVILVF